MTLSSPVVAQDFDKGVNAFNEGDFAIAYKELAPLALEGDPKAQAYLGFIHSDASGDLKDISKAIYWYGLAAHQGNPYAQVNLALMHEQGKNGFTQDYKAAGKLYRMAAEQGHAQAQNNLASLYFNGHGYRRNYTLALEWYRKAALNGHAYAFVNLSSIYAQGLGVEVDYVKSYLWALFADAAGLKEGQFNLSIVEAMLTEKNKAEANELLLECIKSEMKKCDF
ncbi:sel1 repeat family protein [Planktomarina temperata]|nr:sel1 repeat family protein [Planktomarina temperata]